MNANAQQFTNAEVRSARFLCQAPLDQPNLLATLPDGAELRRLENIYELPKTMPKMRCAACRRAIHRKGFTGQLMDGSRVLLGSQCGSETFGSWEMARRDLEELRSRQYYLIQADELRAVEAELWPEIELWREAAKRFDATMLNFSEALPDLYSALVRLARSGGGLSYERTSKLRNITKAGIKLVKLTETVSMGPMPGRTAFLIEPTCELVMRAKRALEHLCAHDASAEAVTRSTALAEANRNAEEAVEALRLVRDAMIGLAELFSAAGLERVEEWAKAARIRGRYIVGGGRIGIEDSDQLLIGLPAGYAPPSARLLELVSPLARRRSVKVAA